MTRARVLIVDDERPNRELLEIMLAPGGFALAGAASGEEALAMVAEQAPDLILLDVLLPGLDGYQVATRLKANQATRSIPIILVSAFDDSEGRRRAQQCGADGFLGKPVAGAKLRALVSGLLHGGASAAAPAPKAGTYTQRVAEEPPYLEAAALERYGVGPGALEEQLRLANRLEEIERMASGFAHDFGNLLSIVLCHGDLITEDLKAEDPIHTNLASIRGASLKALELTRRLLALSREQAPAPASVDLAQIVNGMKGLLARVLGKRVELTILAPASVKKIMANPAQVERAILNLAIHARDAMPEGGRLAIEVAGVQTAQSEVPAEGEVKSGPHVMLSISDTGKGLDEETMAFVQRPLQTFREPAADQPLGLASVVWIVRQLDGTIRVSSEAGAGTTWRLYFPVKARSR